MIEPTGFTAAVNMIWTVKRPTAISVMLLLVSAALSLALSLPLDDDPAKAQITGAVASATNGQLLPRARVFIRRSAQKDAYVTVIDAGKLLFGS